MENSDLKANRRYARRDERGLHHDTAGCFFSESAKHDGDEEDVVFGVSVKDLTSFFTNI